MARASCSPHGSMRHLKILRTGNAQRREKKENKMWKRTFVMMVISLALLVGGGPMIGCGPKDPPSPPPRVESPTEPPLVEWNGDDDLPRMNIPGDGRCDWNEKQGKGKGCKADCGCCWDKTRHMTYNYPFTSPPIRSRPMKKKCVVATGTFCVPSPGIIHNRADSVMYRCISGGPCGSSYDTKGGYRADFTLTKGGRCFVWKRKWCGPSVWEEYYGDYYVKRSEIYSYCTPNRYTIPRPHGKPRRYRKPRR